MNVAGEPVQFGDDESSAMQPAESECFVNSGAVIALAAFDLNHFLYER